MSAGGSYAEFLAGKSLAFKAHGIEVAASDLNPMMFGFQRDITRWALRRGRACIFSECGTGKTVMELEFARHVHASTGRDVLILAPLAVAHQTKREGEKFGVPVTVCRKSSDPAPGINVANYEMALACDYFGADRWGGIILDESSSIKAHTSVTRLALTAAFRETPFRLCCTATPAPNDWIELGTHAEFMGAMTRAEMLAMFFVHDGGSTQDWRLKGHAEGAFWDWCASWAAVMRRPSDLGYSDDGFILPPLQWLEHVIKVPPQDAGYLLDIGSPDLDGRRRARKASLPQRVALAADLANREASEQWIIWCDLNAESEALAAAIDGAVEVTGSMPDEAKEDAIKRFLAGRERVLVSKPSICGWGLNVQCCARVCYVGLSDSFEALYQSVRRCWRFGQTRPVEAHIVIASSEGAVRDNVRRKEKEAAEMADEMSARTAKSVRANLGAIERLSTGYSEERAGGKGWEIIWGDCVPAVKAMPDESVDYSVFSPPFASLYTYSDSERDMGNAKDYGEFFRHFGFLVADLLRVTKPGRLLSFHCMNLPTSLVRDGVIGITDFRGELIRIFCAAGWIYHSEVCIWKDPVTAMQRTKALGLLWKQLKKDSAMSRMGIPDYVVTVRKPGENPNPVSHGEKDFPVALWQKWASPVWDDINPSDTLQKESAREDKDEKHIAPLQLEVIRRCLVLWSNPGDLVLSPFAGIGSEGHVAVKSGRRFVGVELKRSYYEQAVANLRAAETEAASGTLFGEPLYMERS